VDVDPDTIYESIRTNSFFAIGIRNEYQKRDEIQDQDSNTAFRQTDKAHHGGAEFHDISPWPMSSRTQLTRRFTFRVAVSKY